MSEGPIARVPAIDWLKGFAIICVPCIHAKTYETTFVYMHVIDRAVPIFLVLLGATSQTFWELHASARVGERLRQWYRGRLIRLMPPVWLMALAWWCAVVVLDRGRDLEVGWREALLTFLGYSPWAGPTWFITLVLQLVVCFPAIRWLATRLGPFISLPIAAALCIWSTRHVWDIVEFGRQHVSANVYPPGFFYYWIFTPRVVWNVVAGIYIARYWRSRPGLTATLAASVIWVVGLVLLTHLPVAGEEFFVGPVRHQAFENLLDVALTVALLGLLVPFERWQGHALLRFVGFCGRASWGIYIGHVLVYELFGLAGAAPQTGPEAVRVAYAALLLSAGIVLAVAFERIRRVVLRGAHQWPLTRAALRL